MPTDLEFETWALEHARHRPVGRPKKHSGKGKPPKLVDKLMVEEQVEKRDKAAKKAAETEIQDYLECNEE